MIYKALILFNTLKQDILNQNIIQIKNLKIPNFFKTNDLEFQWEFCHQFSELYEPYILKKDGHLIYENEDIQIKENDVVFDCGANMGLFAAYAASKGAQVYCFEPCSSTRELLKKTQLLYPNNIHIIPKAISNKNGEDILLINSNIGANRLYNSRMENNYIKKEIVETITLDSFIKVNKIIPDFIKIDIEGSELDALEGFKLIKNIKPKIAIATYHTPNDVFLFEKYFKQFNYNIKIENDIMFLKGEKDAEL